MDEFKLIVASNLIRLRTSANMTQAELGEKINYSDKTVSKWERAESVPDTYALKQIADIFGVTVDFMLTSHDDWSEDSVPERSRVPSFSMHDIIIVISLVGEAFAAFVVYVIFWILEQHKVMNIWKIFVYTLPVMFVTWLVLNSIWKKGRHNGIIIALLVLSIIAVVYVALLSYSNAWQLFIVAAAAEILVALSFVAVKLKKN